ncbi:MAG: S8 family serine peptidase [Oligoflexia bacterium]|nr:S8 family serine peptidase [Oligoflexia bacterium]
MAKLFKFKHVIILVVTSFSLIVVTPCYSESVEYQSVKLSATSKESFANWGTDPNTKNGSIELKDAWRIFTKKKDVVVAVIDTGIDFNHPHLNKNVYVFYNTPSEQNYGVDFSFQAGASASAAASANASASETKIAESTAASSYRRTPYDQHGHGTHVAGIIKTIFPEVKILAIKYYNPYASGVENLNSTIRALKYAVEEADVDIINYSGGGPEPSTEELRLLKQAERKGILVVAAAGNEHSNIDKKENAYYPASYGLSNIITVTAHNQNAEILPSSNWGRKSVDISAPGQNIRSSLPHERAGMMTGTSQATAFVTGVAALIKSQYADLDAKTIKEVIINSAQRVDKMKDKCVAAGILSANRALVRAQQGNSKSYAIK